MTEMKIPRRIVTGIQNNKSTIIEDGIVTNISEHLPGLVISDLWATNVIPVDLSSSISVENKLFPEIPKNGSYFRYIHIPPDAEVLPYVSNSHEDKDHPLMHYTKSLDYIAILSGEIYLVLENDETLVKAGDIVIQRATHHAWSNRSNSPCIMLAVLLDAKEEERNLIE